MTLATICETTFYLSKDAVQIGGSTISVSSEHNHTRYLSNAYGEPVVGLVQHLLYSYTYASAFTGTLEVVSKPVGDSMVEQLRQANQGTSFWDDGWVVTRTFLNGDVLAVKQSLERRALPGEYVSLGGRGNRPQVGAKLNLFFPHESTDAQAGFYFAFGETPSCFFDKKSVLRIYFNLEAESASALVSLITSRLRKFEIPYRFKCLIHLNLYLERDDGAVLYVNRRHGSIVLALMAAIYEELRDSFADRVPLFTLKLAAGIALAEDPQNGESFGTSRCRIVAEGLFEAFKAGVNHAEGRLEHVLERFRVYYIDPAKPFLNPHSPYEYTFPSSIRVS